MKKLSSFLLAAAILVSMSTALADNAGTSSNPLITRSYLESTIIPEMTGIVDRAIKAYTKVDEYSSSAGRIYDSASGRMIPEDYSVATGYAAVNMPEGSKITTLTGGCVLLSTGDVVLTVESGEVIDLNTAERASGQLGINVRYFAAENTVAVYTARDESVCLVNGPYLLSDGAELIDTGVFKDIDEYAEYYEAVSALVERNIMTGISKDSFELKTDVTSQTIVDSVWTMAGKPGTDAETWARSRGIWIIADGEDNITHEELAYILYRYARSVGLDTSTDVKLTSYEDYYDVAPEYTEAVAWALDKGIIQGSISTVIEPQDIATRQETASALYTVLSMTEE